jgi:tetratricopeptide (TPR) repeat protein
MLRKAKPMLRIAGGTVGFVLAIAWGVHGGANRASAQPESSPSAAGRSLVAAGRFREAVPFLAQALQANPNDREAQRAMAHAMLELNQFSRAQPLLQKLTEADPKDGESWYLSGLLFYRNGYFGAALPALDKSLASRPDVTAQVYRAVCLEKTGRSKEAEAAFLRLSDNPAATKNPDLLLVYAELLYETGRAGLALKQVDRAIEVLPGTPMPYFWRSRILLHENRLDEAAKASEHAVQLAPQLPFARNLLVQIYRRQGRTAEAAQQAGWLREYEDRMARGR